jgi:TnpA family transposase
LAHMTWLESLGEVDAPLSGVPSALLQHFATEAKALHAGELCEVQSPKRYTLLLCLIYRMRIRARDDATEMFVKRMDKIHKQARERLLEIQARQRDKTENLVAALAGVIEAVRSDESSASKVERIDKVFAGRGGIERLQEDCEAVQAWSNNNYFPLLGPPYKRYRYLLLRVVGALRFVSTTQNRSLLDAMAVVQTNQNRRADWVPVGDLDFSFVTDRRWNNVVFRTRNGRREMHWRQFEICMFTHLALELRTCDMAVVGSEQYADYRDRLLPWEECDPLRESYCNKVGLPCTTEEFVQQLRTELETTAAQVDESFPSNTAVSMNNKDGEPVLRRPVANKPPVSAMELEAALQTLLPERSLLDIVWLTNGSTRFTRHFGPISGLEAKLDQIDEKYCAAVFVMGSSMGVTQGARHMRGLVTSPTLALINRRHVTVDKLDAAHRDILDAYNQFELPHCWGTGKTAAFDGSLFELSEQNLLADFHFRYRLKGAVAFQVVSDLYIALFVHFIPPGVWEAIYIIEALMKNKSKIQADTVFADTQGQSTPVFAFTHLLGIKLMPRIRNWKDLTFFRPSMNVTYKHIDGLFKDAIDWELIRTHWRDLMQIALSIYTGRVSSPILLRKLSHYSHKNRLYLAAQELGRVQRTVYLLRWISDLSLRSGVTAGTNSAEGYHALTKWLQFGTEGVIQENDPDEQQKRIRYLGLLASVLIYWNVIEISRAIGELVSQGYPVNKADLAYLNPYITRHIKRFGDYTIHTELAPGPIHHQLSLTRKSPSRAVQQALPFAGEA